MRRFTFYLAFVPLVFSGFLLNHTPSIFGQRTKQRGFFIELQPDSPILIRDLTATILPVNKYRTLPELEVSFYVENRSKKLIKNYSYQDPAENDKKYEDYQERGWGGNLLPGESTLLKIRMAIKGESLVYRIKEVEFEDGTKWRAKPFNAAKAKKSAPVMATVRKAIDNTSPKRILTREWTVPIFFDRVTKILEGRPQVIEGISIQTKLHEIKMELLEEVGNCPIPLHKIEPRSDEVVYIEQNDKVEKFTTYEIKGRVFAYIIPFEAVEAETQYEIGAGFQSVFVDEDGSGIFKLRCEEMDLKSIPQWVKILAEN